MAQRHSLLVRLLVSSAVVAVCSIAATAWLAVQGTSGAIRQQQGQTIEADAKIYDALLGHAAVNPTWSGVDRVISDLTAQTGRHITLTSEARQRIAGADVSPLPVKASAVVDARAVDVSLTQGDRVDPRVVGPFRLTDEERALLRKNAESQVVCLGRSGIDARIVERPSGRPYLEMPGITSNLALLNRCGPVLVTVDDALLDQLTATETGALAQLTRLVGDCLSRQGGTPTKIALDGAGRPRVLGDNAGAEVCLDSSRRDQLAPFTAPAALLFIGDNEGVPATGLTAASTTRIVVAALGVLVLTILVSVLVATRLVRPMRALTVAAQRMRAGDRTARVPIRAKGEIGELAEAFNEMSEHLERTEDQRKSMISDVSHELRTPLGNIRGWLVATQDGLAELDEELVASLLEESVLLQHLVDDLQQLALADAGQLRLHPEPVNAGDLLDQVAAAHRIATVRKEGDLDLVADPLRLRQAVGNLLANAVRHSGAHGRVELAARRVGDQVVIDVSDTGGGIAPEDLPHVFERFWRADKSRSRQTGGSGLGLAIVRHLVEAHGGTVEVVSTLGEGSTFTLKLPAQLPNKFFTSAGQP